MNFSKSPCCVKMCCSFYSYLPIIHHYLHSSPKESYLFCIDFSWWPRVRVSDPGSFSKLVMLLGRAHRVTDQGYWPWPWVIRKNRCRKGNFLLEKSVTGYPVITRSTTFLQVHHGVCSTNRVLGKRPGQNKFQQMKLQHCSYITLLKLQHILWISE